MVSRIRSKAEKIHQSNRYTENKLGFIDSLNLYTRLLADKISGGIIDTPETPLGDGEFYYTSDRIYTRKGVKKALFLHELPPELPRGFISDLRNLVDADVRSFNTTHEMDEELYISLVLDARHYDLDFSKRSTQGRWSYFARQYEQVQRKAGNKKLEDELKDDKYSEGVRRKVNSFLYMKEAKESDSSFFKTTAIIEFIATSNDILEVGERTLKKYLYTSRVKTKQVFIQTNVYQKAFMPTASARNTLLNQMYPGDVWTDDILASFSLMTHGKVGDPIGIYHGIDIESKLPVTLDLSKGSDANNILLTASSGEGKSNMAKMIYTFLISLDDTYRTIIMDYEGGQYDAIGMLANASIVTMGGGEGRYVNTMAIGDLTGKPELDNMLKTEAIESTERVFHLLCSTEHDSGMSKHETALFSDAINEVYLDFGVKEDKNTWYRSKDVTFFHIYAKLLSYKNNKDKIMEYGLDEINDFVITLKPYFEKGGSKNHWFKDPISVQEIQDNKHLIFSFGMYGQDESMTDEKSIALRQMFVSYLVNLLASKNRAVGLRTVIFVEEMQRYLKQKYSGQILAGMSSGGRKLGMIVYYITNSPAELLTQAEMGFDSEGQSPAATIISNMNIVLLGALPRSDMDDLIDQFGLDNSQSVLYQLSEIREKNLTKEGAPLKYCFYLRYRGQSTVVRTLSHPALDELPLYATTVDADTGEGYEKDGKLKMNVGEEAIKAKIEMAVREEESLQRRNDNEWRNRMSDDNIWMTGEVDGD